MTQGARRWLLLGGGIALSGALLYFSFRKLHLGELRDEIANVNPLALVLVPMVRMLNFGVPALRSQILFAPLTKLDFGRQFKSVLLAFAVNTCIPARAGEFARVGYLARYGGLAPSTCLAVVGLERLLDLVGLAAIVMCVLPLAAVSIPHATPFYLLLGIGAAAVAGAMYVNRHPQLFVRCCRLAAGLFGTRIRDLVGRRAETFADGLAGLRSLTAIVAVVMLTFLFWALAALSLSIWFWAFDFSLPWYASVVVLAFLSFGLAIPSTPGNIGVFHFFTISALTSMGIGQTEAASYAIVTHAMAVVPYTLLAIPLLLRDYAKARAAASANTQAQPELA